MIAPEPDDARIAIRSLSYPNSTSENAAIEAVEQAVFDRVRSYEQTLVFNAHRFEQQAQVHVEAAGILVEALREEIRFPIHDRAANATDDRAVRYVALKQDAERAIAALDRAEREAEFHEAKCLDPYRSYADLMKRWPVLRMGKRL